MRVIMLYDITSDRIRQKIADTCLDYGLDRTQFSAFIGELSRNHQEALMLKVGRLLGDEPGSVLLVPIGQTEWSRRTEIRNQSPENTTTTSAEDHDLSRVTKHGPADDPYPF